MGIDHATSRLLDDNGVMCDAKALHLSRSLRWYRRRPIQITLTVFIVIVGFVCFLLNLILKLRNTSFVLQELHLPDLCSDKSMGVASIHFENPSFCDPTIGPVDITISDDIHHARLLMVHIPAFSVASGVSSVSSAIIFSIVASAKTLQRVLFESPTPTFAITGVIPLHISCLVFPFTIHLDVQDFLHATPTTIRSLDMMWEFTRYEENNNDEGDDSIASAASALSSSSSFDIAAHIQEMVQAILRTFGLAKGHLDNDREGIFVFTNVTFDYTSRIQWTIPNLNFHMTHPAMNQTLFTAGFYGFNLGGGPTHIGAFSYVKHDDAKPLEDVVQAFLTGQMVHVTVVGDNALSNCVAQQLLNAISFPVVLPGTIDGKPAFLRHYDLHPTLKKLDSESKTCELRLDVALAIHNRLPVELDVRHVQFDVLYENTSYNVRRQQQWVATAISAVPIAWPSQAIHEIAFAIVVTNFTSCQDLLRLYLADTLSFSLHHGTVSMALGHNPDASDAFDVPFQVDDIRIHPPQPSIIRLG
jgi:hypothetical protein